MILENTVALSPQDRLLRQVLITALVSCHIAETQSSQSGHCREELLPPHSPRQRAQVWKQLADKFHYCFISPHSRCPNQGKIKLSISQTWHLRGSNIDPAKSAGRLFIYSFTFKAQHNDCSVCSRPANCNHPVPLTLIERLSRTWVELKQSVYTFHGC